MNSYKPPVRNETEAHLSVGPPKRSAAGLPSLIESIPLALTEMGPERAVKTLTAMNQKDGFDCMSCAWPDPPERKMAQNSVKTGPKR